MIKENIKTKLFSMQENIIVELSEKVQMSHSLVDLDEDDTHDPDDYSHQFESAEMEQLMKVQLNKAKGGLEKLKSIDFSEKSTVQTGAYVETNKFNFFIGFSTVPFDVEGKHVVGISTNSPIFPMMSGKAAADKFSYCGINYEIETIY
ncbi:MAG: hypothetical protein QNK23_05650 [Crocinitomicaceae bacterium]|nr:hypothetical protein [Crocinitomicaceae bacterium]